MNLQRVGQRARFQGIDNGHHGVLYGQVETNWVHLNGLVLGTTWGAFFGASGVLGVFAPRPFCLSLLPFYSSFLLLEWSSWGRYLSYQPFPPVVGSGCKDREVWLCQAQGTECNNGSPSLRHFRFLRCPFLLQYFSCFVERYGVSLLVVGCFFYTQLYPCRGGFSPWSRRDFSLGWAPGPVQTLTWAYWSLTPHKHD